MIMKCIPDKQQAHMIHQASLMKAQSITTKSILTMKQIVWKQHARDCTMTPFINNIQSSLRSQHLASCGLTTTLLLSTELLSNHEVCNLCAMLKQTPTCLTAEGGFNVVFDPGTTKPVSFNKDNFIGELRPSPIQPLLMRGIS